MHPSTSADVRIAIIDDDHGTRELLAELLADEAYSVVLWSGEEDPVRLVQDTAPQLVILDLHLGGGFQACDVIDALCGDSSIVQVPVIVCSADGVMIQRDRQAFDDRGCVVVEKPFDLYTMLDAIRNAVTSNPSPGTNRNQATGSS